MAENYWFAHSKLLVESYSSGVSISSFDLRLVSLLLFLQREFVADAGLSFSLLFVSNICKIIKHQFEKHFIATIILNKVKLIILY